MGSVYPETSFISYLVARPSRDVIVAGHQQTALGDPAEVQKRLAIIAGLPTLEVAEDAKALAKAIMAAGMLPPHAFPDAAHVAAGAKINDNRPPFLPAV